jgi:hypothetical protein
MKKITLAFTFCLATGIAAPIYAQSNAQTAPIAESEVETLRKQLAAQRAINEQLKQRVDALERQLASGGRSGTPVVVGLDTSAPKPVQELSSDQPISAIEEALGEKGLVLLPTGMYRFTPSLTWVHNGSGFNRQDSAILGMSLEAGLPMGMAIAIRQPYIWDDDEFGNANGSGNTSISLAKKLNNETESMPSFVARLGYTFDNGDSDVTSGFKAYSASLSAVKRVDPLVFYGSASYAYRPSETRTVSGVPTTVKLGETYGLNMGVSLAATPDVSLDAGLSFAFTDKVKLDGTAVSGTRSTEGYVDLGAGIRLTRNLFLSLSASAGVTDDAADFIFSVALPYRF